MHLRGTEQGFSAMREHSSNAHAWKINLNKRQQFLLPSLSRFVVLIFVVVICKRTPVVQASFKYTTEVGREDFSSLEHDMQKPHTFDSRLGRV